MVRHRFSRCGRNWRQWRSGSPNELVSTIRICRKRIDRLFPARWGSRCSELLDEWLKIARQAQEEGSNIQYQREATSPPRRLLYEFLDPALSQLHPIYGKFRANRSMRDVEPAVEVLVKNLNDWGDKE